MSIYGSSLESFGRPGNILNVVFRWDDESGVTKVIRRGTLYVDTEKKPAYIKHTTYHLI